MIENVFYHNTIRKYTVAFGSIFNGISIERENKAGEVLNKIPVPLIYADKEKFVRRARELSSISPDEIKVKETLPMMGFELASMNYSPQRKTNTMERILNSTGNKGKFMFNRVPYDFTYVLHVAARRTDDALRIIEQVLPYFSPELTVEIKDMKDFPDMRNNIDIVLLDAAPQIDADGDFNDRRTILWQLTFTLKGYLYMNVRDVDTIKKTIVDISDSELNTFFEGYMSQIDPLNAGSADPHDVEEVITVSHREDQTITGDGGANAQATLD